MTKQRQLRIWPAVLVVLIFVATAVQLRLKKHAWTDLALRCKYISEEEANELDKKYDGILGQLVRMIDHPEQWSIRKDTSTSRRA